MPAKSNAFHWVASLAAALALTPSLWLARAQQTAPQVTIEVQGLKASYSSCSLVKMSVYNLSRRSIYVDVYVERFISGSWADDEIYAINDAHSLYSKAVRIDLIKAKTSLQVSYDRCLKPTFVTQTEQEIKSTIGDLDRKAEKSGTRTQQRIRVDVHERGRARASQKVWSDPFERFATEDASSGIAPLN